jgi:peptide/nickel transport system substrate-binding protein
MRGKRLGIVVLVLAVATSWFASTASSRNGSTGSLVVAATTAPDTLDPQKSALNQTWPAWQLSYECLLRVTPAGKITPSLATNYRVNAAGTVYDFTLRKGVRFQNGERLTASDVVYTFQRLKQQGIPYAQNRFPTLQNVTALSASKVRFTLSSPQPGFLLNMGDPFTVACAILSKKAATANLASKMVGTGPFSMVSYSPNRQLVMKRFTGYWGKKPKVSKLTVLYMPDPSAQLVALSSGKVDLIFPDASLVKALQNSKQIKFSSVIAATGLRVEMSTKSGPTADPDVRRAIELAVDKRAVVAGAYLGYGAPATYLPSSYKWAPNASAYQYSNVHANVAKAKKLLAQAGYPNGFTTTYIYPAGFSPTSDRFAQVLQSQLAQIGIKLNLEALDTPTWLSKLGAADYGLSFNQYPYFSDPSLYVAPRASRNGPTPPQITQLVNAMNTATSNAKYLQAISALAQAEDDLGYPNFVIASPTQFVAYRGDHVHHVKIDFSVSWLFLTNVTVS